MRTNYMLNMVMNVSIYLSGQQIDDRQPRRQKIKVTNPPGGKSSNLW